MDAPDGWLFGHLLDARRGMDGKAMKKTLLCVGLDLTLEQDLNADQRLTGQWDLLICRSVAQAHVLLKEVDAILLDASVGVSHGPALLQTAREQRPSALRFLLMEMQPVQASQKFTGCAHQILVKPASADIVRRGLERAVSLQVWLPGDNVQQLVGAFPKLPSPPAIYFKVVKELQRTDASLERAGEIICSDPAMAARLLQVVNSAVFGLRSPVTRVEEAILHLGIDRTKSLILLTHSFSYFENLKPGVFNVEALWRHSIATAKLAEKIARHMGLSPEECGEAYTGGLLHDLGKLIIAANLPELLTQAVELSRSTKRPMWLVEREILGSDHGEVAGCVLGAWGLSSPILEAIALHHRPTRMLNDDPTPLTAVHLANNMDLTENGEDAPPLEGHYLDELHVSSDTDFWRKELIAA